MSRKINAPKISQVIYFYFGTNEEFNYFLKAVVKDYIGSGINTAENEKSKCKIRRNKFKAEFCCIFIWIYQSLCGIVC